MFHNYPPFVQRMKKKIYFCLSGYINHSGMSAQTTPPQKTSIYSPFLSKFSEGLLFIMHTSVVLHFLTVDWVYERSSQSYLCHKQDKGADVSRSHIAMVMAQSLPTAFPFGFSYAQFRNLMIQFSRYNITKRNEFFYRVCAFSDIRMKFHNCCNQSNFQTSFHCFIYHFSAMSILIHYNAHRKLFYVWLISINHFHQSFCISRHSQKYRFCL